MMIGQKIKSLRLYKHNWAVDDLSEAINVNVSTIQKWERGIALPSFPNIVRLLDVFGITFDELMKGVDL